MITPHDLWRDLCEKDDRTSPEDYPDMALITEDEFVSMLQQYGDERAHEKHYQEIVRLHGCYERDTAELQYELTTAAERYAEIEQLTTEIARLRAPPGADALERARRLIVELNNGEPFREDDSDLLPTARALQQYGDERAAAAREAGES